MRQSTGEALVKSSSADARQKCAFIGLGASDRAKTPHQTSYIDRYSQSLLRRNCPDLGQLSRLGSTTSIARSVVSRVLSETDILCRTKIDLPLSARKFLCQPRVRCSRKFIPQPCSASTPTRSKLR